jgi:hypothetical protein
MRKFYPFISFSTVENTVFDTLLLFIPENLNWQDKRG